MDDESTVINRVIECDVDIVDNKLIVKFTDGTSVTKFITDQTSTEEIEDMVIKELNDKYDKPNSKTPILTQEATD